MTGKEIKPQQRPKTFSHPYNLLEPCSVVKSLKCSFLSETRFPSSLVFHIWPEGSARYVTVGCSQTQIHCYLAHVIGLVKRND